MEKKHKKPVLFILLFSSFILLIILLMQPLELHLRWNEIAVLFPKGWVGLKQRNLLLIIQAIMLLVVIPVYILTFLFSWIYRAHNSKAKYDPNLDDSPLAEYLWWGIPFILVVIISIFTWRDTDKLDPFKPLVSDKKPIHIQVVALQWKWLFIYPEEQIASLNFLQFPKDRPLNFELTSDAPMNSFWIPDLGGQIYAMPKMRTKLHLIANQEGEFRGSSANISGDGFASMHFIAKASSEEEYQKWLEQAKSSPHSLTFKAYNDLAKPSKENTPTLYSLPDSTLFDQIIMKYMEPPKTHE